MPKNSSPDDYYRAARELLPEMEESTRQAVEDLLKKAESGVKTDNLIVETVSQNSDLRRKFRDVLGVQEKSLGVDFSGLGGNVSSPDTRKFICPEPGCERTHRIQKAGEDPGLCPKHNLPLIPLSEKKGGGK